MPSKTRAKNAVIAAKSAAPPKVPKELLDQPVKRPMTAEAIQDVSMAFKKALIEWALGGKLSHRLGCAPGGDKPAEADNHRSGSAGKMVLTGRCEGEDATSYALRVFVRAIDMAPRRSTKQVREQACPQPTI